MKIGLRNMMAANNACSGRRGVCAIYKQVPGLSRLRQSGVISPMKLDEAVFAAYGWKSDLSDEEILEKLLVLNLERSKAGK